MSDILEFERVPRFRRLAEYLAARAPAGRLPGRQHIDPVEIPDLLPYLSLIDVIRQGAGPLRFRFRLVGTQVAARFGYDYTGKFADEIFLPHRVKDIIAGYTESVEERQPQFRRTTLSAPNREHVTFERIVFPLARDGETVDMLIGVYNYP